MPPAITANRGGVDVEKSKWTQCIPRLSGLDLRWVGLRFQPVVPFACQDAELLLGPIDLGLAAVKCVAIHARRLYADNWTIQTSILRSA